jgi:[ribosomal protein S5]-alanine N-acetyltransferase
VPGLPLPANLSRDGVALRRLRGRDAGPFAQAFRDDPGLGPALGMEEDPSEGWARRYVAAQARLRARGQSLALAVSDAPKGPFHGVVLLHSVVWRDRRAELGFWLVAGARGAGRARAAVGLLADWAFAELPLDRLELMTTPGNAAALGVAAALGFEREGLLRARRRERGRPVDVVMLARLRACG